MIHFGMPISNLSKREKMNEMKRMKETKAQVLGCLLQALHKLEKSSPFAKLIPEVRVNLAYALPNAETPEDVAGIEGRITVVNGQPKASGSPQFGASDHMARAILQILFCDNKKGRIHPLPHYCRNLYGYNSNYASFFRGSFGITVCEKPAIREYQIIIEIVDIKNHPKAKTIVK